jgi:hypothetical protein
MSDFIMIAPEGWVLLSVDYENQGLISMSDVTGVPLSTTIEVATVAMLGRGDMTENQTIVDFRRINDEYWVKLV